jgi:hypothetical protein
MISKVHKKTLSVALMTALLLSLPLVPAQGAWDVLGGILIQATPFDRKIDSAGVLRSHGFAALLESVRSSDELFLQARSIRYTADGAQDYWQTPTETESRWAGDCEDKAIWLYAQLKRNGYFNARLVVGRYRITDKNYHVWVSMPDGQDGFFVLDPTAQKKIWKSSDFGDGFYQPLYSFDGINRYRHKA